MGGKDAFLSRSPTVHDRALNKILEAISAVQCLPFHNDILVHLDDAFDALEDWQMPTESDLNQFACDQKYDWDRKQRQEEKGVI